jgi:antitoxin component YwqK of YwqJK toxin-antitoxin module
MERRVQSPVKWLTLIVLFAACFSEQYPEQEDKWYNEAFINLQNENEVYTLNGRPFSGIVYSLAANKKDTVAVGSFLNGKEDGEWRRYYINGQISDRRFYSKGKKAGVYAGWWPNGTKRLLYHFCDGEYEGNCSDWNDKGTLVSSMHYTKGYETGLQQQFYENGKVKANYMMIEGRRYGLLGTKNCVNVSDSVFSR